MKYGLALALLVLGCATSSHWQYVGPQGMPDWNQARAFCYGQVGQPPALAGDTTAMTLYVIRHNACLRGQGWQLVSD